jgi:hypothetical protein
MRAALGMWVVATAQVFAGAAWAGDGLTVPQGRAEAAWPRWQARVTANDAPLRSAFRPPHETGLNLQGSSVVGDFYFARSPLVASAQGGFRATGGLFVGTRFDNATSTLPGPSGQAPGANLASRYALTGPGSLEGLTATSYVGVGYTALSGRDGWGFSADLGLVSQGMKLGASQVFRPGLDDGGLRDNRLVAPLLRFGVSYSF